MIDSYEIFDIMKMAEFLKLRKRTQGTTLLFLGSRAGGLYRSNFLYNALCYFSTNFHRLSPLQQFDECFHILNRDRWSPREVDEILHTTLKQANLEEADACIAQLSKRRFFNRLVTTNIDGLLEQAFVWNGMKEFRDFDVVVVETDGKQMPISSKDKTSSFPIIKVFGDLDAGTYNITNRPRHLELAGNLRRFMDDIRSWHILIVGFDPIWDAHMIPALFPRKGTVWYVNEEPPYETSTLADALRTCNAQYIIGPQGAYQRFFQDLYQLIADSTDPLHPLSDTGPIVFPENVEQTIRLKNNTLKWQAEEVLRKESTPPTSLKVTIERLYSHLPSAVLTYYRAETMPLIKYTIVNDLPEAVSVVLSSEIQGLSAPCIDTVVVAPQTRSVHYQLPSYKGHGTLSALFPAFVYTSVSYLKDGVEVPYSEQSHVVYLTARNVIRWAVPAREGGFLPLFEHLAAWVTPNTDAVNAMYYSATDYHPQKVLNGYPLYSNPEVVRSQARAIFQALKKVGRITFVNTPITIGTGAHERLQTIQLPNESLRDHQANSIDGAVLYASLLERAGLHPVIVIQPGNAFVGWKTSKDGDSYEFLDTTMTANASFEQAHAKGTENYRSLQEIGWFKREPFDPHGFAHLLDIKTLRDKGISAMDPS